jgi:hypothetical protein
VLVALVAREPCGCYEHRGRLSQEVHGYVIFDDRRIANDRRDSVAPGMQSRSPQQEFAMFDPFMNAYPGDAVSRPALRLLFTTVLVFLALGSVAA